MLDELVVLLMIEKEEIQNDVTEILASMMKRRLLAERDIKLVFKIASKMGIHDLMKICSRQNTKKS
jgi:hypothetical protein